MKRLIVVGLERTCTLLDHIPPQGKWGCYYLRLAQRSAELDEKWQTGVWE